MTSAVRPPSPRDQAWAELAAELTPAKSLARIDTVTARAVTTVTVIGVLLTGLGVVSAAEPTQGEPAKAFAVSAVITAALAVGSALTAQVLTVTRRLNPANLTEVKTWFHRQFTIRAYPTQVATLLVLLAALLAGAAAVTALLAPPASSPTFTITQSLQPARQGSATATAANATVTATVIFRGLTAGQVITLTLTSSGIDGVLARAATTAAPDGTATATLTASLAAARPATVTATASGEICQGVLTPNRPQPALSCHAR